MTKEELAHARDQIALATTVIKKIEDIDAAMGITDATAVYKHRGAIQTIPDSLLKDVILVGLVTLKRKLESELVSLSIRLPAKPGEQNTSPQQVALIERGCVSIDAIRGEDGAYRPAREGEHPDGKLDTTFLTKTDGQFGEYDLRAGVYVKIPHSIHGDMFAPFQRGVEEWKSNYATGNTSEANP